MYDDTLFFQMKYIMIKNDTYPQQSITENIFIEVLIFGFNMTI